MPERHRTDPVLQRRCRSVRRPRASRRVPDGNPRCRRPVDRIL